MSSPPVRAPLVVVSEVFPPAIGGSGALLENVYRRFEGRRVRVLAGDDSGLAPYEGPLDVSRVSMSAPDWGLRRPASLGRHLRVARAIRRMLPDGPAMVHCARALPEGLSAALALSTRPGRYAVWLHGEELGFASTSRELTWLARRVYAGAAMVFANSHNSGHLLTRDWGVPESRIHVVYPGVDAQRFHPGIDGSRLRSRVAGPDDVLFLSVGRLQRRKGHDMVLRALARVRARVPFARYVIVGDGPHRGALEADVQALGLADIVHFAGASQFDDLPRWYSAADVFVMPNRPDGVDFEGFGMVFLEAAASGKPSIGGRSGGVPEAVEDGVTGRLVDGENVADIENAMADLAESHELRARYGTSGRERVVRDFTWERAAREVEHAD
jgi:phosphatidylinositol alpha-1,6-mannosyltransferase